MVVLSDLHLGKVQDTIEIKGLPSRLYDTKMRVFEAISYAAKRGESVAMAGDVFDSASPNPIVISVFFEILRFAEKRNVKLFIIPGNHDCGVKYTSMQYMTHNHTLSTVIHSPTALLIDGLNVVFLPHVPKSVIDVTGYQKWVVDKLTAEETKKIDVVIGHAHLSGASNASDVELEAGDAIHFNPSKFFKYKLGVFGHIHKYQELGKNVYCGPVCTNSFDEATIEKGFIHVTKKDDVGYKFVPFATEETGYKQLTIDLVNKDSINYDPEKMAKLAKGKLLKLVVHARDMMQVDQVEIRKRFDEYGTVVRFEIVLNDKYAGESEDDDVAEVFENINYKPVFKAWIKDKPDMTDEMKKKVLAIGYDVIEEVLNASRARA